MVALAIVQVFRIFDWLSSVSGAKIMAETPKFRENF